MRAAECQFAVLLREAPADVPLVPVEDEVAFTIGEIARARNGSTPHTDDELVTPALSELSTSGPTCSQCGRGVAPGRVTCDQQQCKEGHRLEKRRLRYQRDKANSRTTPAPSSQGEHSNGAQRNTAPRISPNGGVLAILEALGPVRVRCVVIELGQDQWKLERTTKGPT